MASAADLVPAVEAYLEANGLQKTLAAMKAEAKAKNLTPSKKVRPLLTRKHTHAHFHRTLRVGGGFFFFFFSRPRACAPIEQKNEKVDGVNRLGDREVVFSCTDA